MNHSTATAELPLLIVDDDHVFRNRLRRGIEQRGYTCLEAGCAEEAVSLATGNSLRGAVIDLRIERTNDGLEAVRAIRALQKLIPIVMLTGYGSIATALEAVKLGASDYITKPAGLDQILKSLGLALVTEKKVDYGTARQFAPTLASVEWEHIQRVLRECQGNITQAASVLGIPRRTLQRKLAKLPATF